MNDYDQQHVVRLLEIFRRYLPPFLCLVAGFLTTFTVPLVGAFPIGEAVLLMVFPFVVLHRVMRREWPGAIQQSRWFRALLPLIAVTLLGYIVSDWYRQSPESNYLRGWARIVFMGIDLVAVSYLVDASWTRFRLFALALVAGFAVHSLVEPPVAGEYWKFGIGFPLTVLALVLAGRRGAVFQVATAFAFALLHVGLGYRSAGGICLLVASALAIRHLHGLWRIPAWILSLVAAGTMVSAIQRNFEEDEAHQSSNTERQSMIEASAIAFVSSPLIGQGSWFTSGKGIARVEEQRARHDPKFHEYTAEEARDLSIHSQLLTGLAEAGLLGGAFLLPYGFLLLTTFASTYRIPTPDHPLVLFLLGSALWDFAMSPFSGESRVTIALASTLCLLIRFSRRVGYPIPAHES